MSFVSTDRNSSPAGDTRSARLNAKFSEIGFDRHNPYLTDISLP